MATLFGNTIAVLFLTNRPVVCLTKHGWRGARRGQSPQAVVPVGRRRPGIDETAGHAQQHLVGVPDAVGRERGWKNGTWWRHREPPLGTGGRTMAVLSLNATTVRKPRSED